MHMWKMPDRSSSSVILSEMHVWPSDTMRIPSSGYDSWRSSESISSKKSEHTVKHLISYSYEMAISRSCPLSSIHSRIKLYSYGYFPFDTRIFPRLSLPRPRSLISKNVLRIWDIFVRKNVRPCMRQYALFQDVSRDASPLCRYRDEGISMKQEHCNGKSRMARGSYTHRRDSRRNYRTYTISKKKAITIRQGYTRKCLPGFFDREEKVVYHISRLSSIAFYDRIFLKEWYEKFYPWQGRESRDPEIDRRYKIQEPKIYRQSEKRDRCEKSGKRLKDGIPEYYESDFSFHRLKNHGKTTWNTNILYHRSFSLWKEIPWCRGVTRGEPMNRERTLRSNMVDRIFSGMKT